MTTNVAIECNGNYRIADITNICNTVCDSNNDNYDNDADTGVVVDDDNVCLL